MTAFATTAVSMNGLHVRLFALTVPAAVFGCLPYTGPPKTIEDMRAGALATAKREFIEERQTL